MKKSLIALAVAGALAAPAAFASATIYGNFRMSVDHSSVDAPNRDAWSINDRASRFGIRGTEDLGGGLRATWQWEQGLNAVRAPIDSDKFAGVPGNEPMSLGTTRNTFIGIAGPFGTVLVGRHDTPYKLGGSADVFVDTVADSARNGALGIIGRNGFDVRAAGTLAYVSPTWSGFSFTAAIVPGEEAGGTAANNDANGLMDAYSLMGSYVAGPLRATLSHESYSREILGATGDKDAWKFNIGYKFGDISVGYTYECSDDGTAANNTDSGHLASVRYDMGPIALLGQYGRFNNDEANAVAAGAQNDMTRWALGANYAFSKRTTVYAIYNMDDQKNTGAQTGDVNTLSIGMNHSF